MFNSRLPLLVALVAFLLVGVVAAGLIWRLEQGNLHSLRQHASKEAVSHANSLQRSIERALSATYALAALVQQGGGRVRDFDVVANNMLSFYPGVSSLQLAPGGVVRSVVPLAGNEQAIGHDLLKDPTRTKAAFLARDTGRLTLDGPFNLVQGGVGAVGRLPVYVSSDSGSQRSFWGFTNVLIRFPEVIEAAGLSGLSEQGFAWELRRIHPDSGQKQIIAGFSSAALTDPVTYALNVPNTTWTLSVAPVAGWFNPSRLAVRAALGLLFSLLLAYLAKLLVELRAHKLALERRVAERTAELETANAILRASESRYRAVTESATDAIVTADAEGDIVGWNAGAERIFGHSAADVLGQSLTLLMPQRYRDAHLHGLRSAQAGRDRRVLGKTVELHGLRKSGAEFPLELSLSAWGAADAQFFTGILRDITERKQREEELRTRESVLRQMRDSMLEGCQIIGFDWRYRYINDAAQRHNRRPKEELLGRTVMECWPGFAATEIFAAEKACMEQRTTHRLDIEFAFPDGSKGWYRVIVQAVPEGIVVYSEDITGRRAAEAKIRRLTQLYAALSQCNQAIVRCTSEAELFPQICRDAVQFGGMKTARISLVDPGTRMVRVAASFGYGAEDLQNLEVFMDADSPFGRGPTGSAIREDRPYWCQDFMNDAAAAPWHERGARLGWGSVAALPLHKNGVVVGAFIVFDGEAGAFDEPRRELLLEMAADISFALDNFERESRRRRAEQELRESEARFRSLTEMSSDFYWETDIGHRLIQRSEGRGDSALSVLAHDSPIGKRRWELPYLSPDEAGWQAHRAMLEAHLPFRNFELWRLGTDGAPHIYSISGDPVFDASGAFQGYRGVGTSITERRRHEEELQRLNEELEQRVAERTQALEIANNELEAFSYSVSHDLRAPLRAIHGFSRLVLDRYAGQIVEQGRDMLRRVSAGADKMGQLIDDLLRLSRISRQAMQAGPVDLSALAREVIEELQAGEPERRVEWIIAPQVSAKGDPGLIRVVLQNLIGNAWKYSSRRDAARIEFGIGKRGDRPVYFVRDNGVGFDMAHAKKLFGAFQRLHSEAEFPGSGIGLATVARILHRHGGEAWADARVGGGATFYFSLG